MKLFSTVLACVLGVVSASNSTTSGGGTGNTTGTGSSTTSAPATGGAVVDVVAKMKVDTTQTDADGVAALFTTASTGKTNILTAVQDNMAVAVSGTAYKPTATVKTATAVAGHRRLEEVEYYRRLAAGNWTVTLTFGLTYPSQVNAAAYNAWTPSSTVMTTLTQAMDAAAVQINGISSSTTASSDFVKGTATDSTSSSTSTSTDGFHLSTGMLAAAMMFAFFANKF